MADTAALKERLRADATAKHHTAVDRWLTLTRAATPTGQTLTLVSSYEATASRAVGDTISAEVSNPTPYAHMVDGGTRPHVIRARTAKVLRFEVGGQTLFRRQVFHPGTTPRNFFAQPAGDRWHEACESVFG